MEEPLRISASMSQGLHQDVEVPKTTHSQALTLKLNFCLKQCHPTSHRWNKSMNMGLNTALNIMRRILMN
jgi:hypothetical protein